MSSPALVEIVDLAKKYGTMPALKGVSARVAEGEVRVIIGPSGCGKSTLLKSINLLETPDTGLVRVGRDVFRFGPEEVRHSPRLVNALRAQVGMVFQQFELFPHMSAVENVMAGPVTVRRMPRKQARDLAQDLLAKVGLAHKMSSYPRELSGGQAQRVAIARTLAMEPRVILFDEATSALDPELVGEVVGVMRALAEEGRTMIFVTHELKLAREIAHKVTFMDAGSIVEEGSPDEIFSRPNQERTRSFILRSGVS